MPVPLRPKLRPLEIVQVGPKEEFLLALRDPEGFGRALVLPYGAAVLALLMDGNRTLPKSKRSFGSRPASRSR